MIIALEPSLVQRSPPVAACVDRAQSSDCSNCGARALSVCGTADISDLQRLGELAEVIKLKSGAVLIREGDPAPHVFNITAGSLRVYKLLPDGRRQITGFLFAGDFLGLAISEFYVFSAEAMEASTVCRFRKGPFSALVARSPPLEHMLLHRTSHELAAAQNQMLLLGRKTAIERMASFLLDLPGHDPTRPSAPGHVRLPMKRAEIADYLGLTIETVSRVLTRMKVKGLISTTSPHELIVERPERLRQHAAGEV
ncbi:helix-turn-helix domain-containing protein [Brevundimonas variabilis]|uniref:CRP/FNR family transcriptional regulator n=1 Tax=Brevundimonas variabilis TaxID=74312 RepID=A0A7W9CL92_9CAUL|nr:helix-turn-helix domain-containing protein [Brevundimonas variabilis]MBB5747559.1 CRP/FNR family transcriptional regulator [Brevundimonas variabilis]